MRHGVRGTARNLNNRQRKRGKTTQRLQETFGETLKREEERQNRREGDAYTEPQKETFKKEEETTIGENGVESSGIVGDAAIGIQERGRTAHVDVLTATTLLYGRVFMQEELRTEEGKRTRCTWFSHRRTFPFFGPTSFA